MNFNTTRTRFQIGNEVKILSQPDLVGRVLSSWRRDGRRGRFYRVQLSGPSPNPKFKMVRERDLELISEVERALPLAMTADRLSAADLEHLEAIANKKLKSTHP